MQQKQSSSVWLWSSLDTAIASAATLLCLWAVYTEPHARSLALVLSERLSVKNSLLLLLFLLLWTGIHQLSGLYVAQSNVAWRWVALRVAFASALGSVFFLLFPLFNHHQQQPGQYLAVLVFFAAAFGLSLIVRSVSLPILHKIAAARQERSANILILGSGPIAQRVLHSLNSESRKSVVGFIDYFGSHTSIDVAPSLLLGGPDQLERVLMSTAIDEVLIALPLRSCYDEIATSIQICERAGVPVSYSLQPFPHGKGFAQIEQRHLHYLSWRPCRIDQSSDFKRSSDIIGAMLAIVLLSPVIFLVAIAIKVSDDGPVFFSQERYGRYKQRFRMFKFRTMVPDAEARQAGLESANEAQGPVFKISKDPRVTPVGRFLRKTSLDELPQFINVLKGEMSLVGPRPLPLRDVAKFDDVSLMRRFSVKPGLTCIWQVNGRSGTSFDKWIAYDLEYIDTWSLKLDLKILLLTIPAVIRGTGAV